VRKCWFLRKQTRERGERERERKRERLHGHIGWTSSWHNNYPCRRLLELPPSSSFSLLGLKRRVDG